MPPGGADMDAGRSYRPERPTGRAGELYDDMAWYEGRYPSQLRGQGGTAAQGGSRARRVAAMAASDTTGAPCCWGQAP
jgi:hypothetical protein